MTWTRAALFFGTAFALGCGADVLVVDPLERGTATLSTPHRRSLRPPQIAQSSSGIGGSGAGDGEGEDPTKRSLGGGEPEPLHEP